MYGNRGSPSFRGERDEERHRARRRDPRVEVRDAPDEQAERFEESRSRRDRNAGKIAELGGDDEESRARGEADHDRVRDEVDERPQARDAHRELQQADQQREGQDQLDVDVGTRCRQRRHRGEHDERDRVGRARDLVPRRAPERRCDGGQHRAIEAELGRQAGQRGVRDPLRQDDERADEAGHQVGAQRLAGYAVAPRQERKELEC